MIFCTICNRSTAIACGGCADRVASQRDAARAALREALDLLEDADGVLRDFNVTLTETGQEARARLRALAEQSGVGS